LEVEIFCEMETTIIVILEKEGFLTGAIHNAPYCSRQMFREINGTVEISFKMPRRQFSFFNVETIKMGKKHIPIWDHTLKNE